VLIQDGPVNILTDPVFANSIPEPIGYKRLLEIPVALDDLPTIHLVLISHDHNDHFDEKAVKKLVKRDNPFIVMGKESTDLLDKNPRFHTLDWTEQRQFHIKGKTYTVDFLPSCHCSGRGIFDNFKRLWGGFLLTTPQNKTIFYPGDTGYDKDLFQEIYKKHGRTQSSK
jgi:L-ascorbate metabolism protein UlaG (beta-lactamase superfamily)